MAETSLPSGQNPESIEESDPIQFRGIPRDKPGRQNSSLPLGKVFSIQSGSELFRLSGASLTSDSPSYFTKFFEEQISQNGADTTLKTLYIDRDPTIFHDIARHLQGYHIRVLDGSHYVRLFADAQFYSLPRLISQLFDSETFIQIGDRHFQVPRDIFSSPGDTPNFFTLGFAAFFSSPQQIFPGLDRTGLLRPPSIEPPAVPSRSADVFAQLLHLLRGYSLYIRNEEHRSELLRDCRYFHLRGLEQKLIAHEISYNAELQSPEILIRLTDLKSTNVSYRVTDFRFSDLWIRYQRPYVDPASRVLLLETGGSAHDHGGEDDSSMLDFTTQLATFHGHSRAKIISLLEALQAQRPGNAAHTPLSLSLCQQDKVKFRLDPSSTDITLNGKTFFLRDHLDSAPPLPAQAAPASSRSIDPLVKKRKLGADQVSQAESLLHSPLLATRRDLNDADTVDSYSHNFVIPDTNGNEYDESYQLPSSSPSSPNLWNIHTAQWRLKLEPIPIPARHTGDVTPPLPQQLVELVLVAVKLDAFTGERAKNARRRFLAQ